MSDNFALGWSFVDFSGLVWVWAFFHPVAPCLGFWLFLVLFLVVLSCFFVFANGNLPIDLGVVKSSQYIYPPDHPMNLNLARKGKNPENLPIDLGSQKLSVYPPELGLQGQTCQ